MPFQKYSGNFYIFFVFFFFIFRLSNYYFSLDHEKKEELIDCIETLMGDNTTLVLGSAIAAFSEVCPERIDLLHPHFRKFCNMLADIDEWGQISVVNILTRYARTQFGNPNPNEVCSFFVR